MLVWNGIFARFIWLKPLSTHMSWGRTITTAPQNSSWINRLQHLIAICYMWWFTRQGSSPSSTQASAFKRRWLSAESLVGASKACCKAHLTFLQRLARPLLGLIRRRQISVSEFSSPHLYFKLYYQSCRNALIQTKQRNNGLGSFYPTCIFSHVLILFFHISFNSRTSSKTPQIKIFLNN